MPDFLKLKPGTNLIRVLPPEGWEWDYPRFRLVPEEKTRVSHAADRWKSCPMCVRETVQGLVDFLKFVELYAPRDSNPQPAV